MLSALFGLGAVWLGITIAYLAPSIPPSSAIVGVAVATYAAAFMLTARPN
jgi:ABC-type Mn2+/Zn2+ transport system permease subunit